MGNYGMDIDFSKLGKDELDEKFSFKLKKSSEELDLLKEFSDCLDNYLTIEMHVFHSSREERENLRKLFEIRERLWKEIERLDKELNGV